MSALPRLCALTLLASIPALAQVSLTEALDVPGWAWTTSAGNPFVGLESADADHGGDLARGVIVPEGHFWGGGIFENWLETTVTGPGVFRILVCSSGDPYLDVALLVDGVEVDRWEPDSGFGAPILGDWQELSGAIHPGSHTVRVRACFGCQGLGTLPVDHPALDADHADLLPLDPSLGVAMNATGQQWYASGEVSTVEGEESHDGIVAARIASTASTGWIETVVTGPATASWWRKGPTNIQIDRLAVASGSPADADWIREVFLVPPGEKVIRWRGVATLDQFSSQPESERSLQDALDSSQILTQGGGGTWRGITTEAAPDGEDLAWLELHAGEDPTWIETTIEGPAALEYVAVVRGNVRFSVTDNGRIIDLGYGLIAKERPDPQRMILPPGTHLIRFEASHGTSTLPFSPHGLLMLDQLTITPLPSVTLGAALDATNLAWTIGGDHPWSGVASALAPDGEDAVVSPELSGEERAWLETRVSGPGTFSFQWIPGLGNSNDRQWKFLVDGKSLPWAIEQRRDPFYSRFLELGPGEHSLRWEIEGSVAGSALLLDQVAWTPANEPPFSKALDLPPSNIHWQNIGWTLAPNEARDGADALRFGIPGTYHHLTALTLRIQGPATVSFYAKTGPHCSLQYRTNGVPRTVVTTQGAWQQFSLQIPPGARNLDLIPANWRFAETLEECVWIDEFRITSNSVPISNVLNVASPNLAWSINRANPWVGIDRPGQSSLVAAGRALSDELSWLETQVQGPAVIKFLARGQGSSYQPGLRVLVDGALHTSVSSTLHKWVILYLPRGPHSLRFEAVPGLRQVTPEILLFDDAPMAGEPTIRVIEGSLEVTVPRPDGYSDQQIGMNLSDRLDLLGRPSAKAHHATIFLSTPEVLILRCDLSIYPVPPKSFFAAASFEP